MAPEIPGHDRLNSWKEIAAYVGRDVRTVIRWEQRAGLPVHRIPVGQRQAVHAYRSEIDAWMRQGSESTSLLPSQDHTQSVNTRIANQADLSSQTSPVVASTNGTRYPSSRAAKLLCLSVLGTVFVVIASGFTYSITTTHQLMLTALTQLTKDGNEKEGLVTDGKTLYFGERRNARTQLAAVSIEGGPVRLIQTPLVDAIPTEVSPDGRNLLVLDAEGQEHERQLWIISADGRDSRRVGTILCHFATWSPDGRHIAFAYRNGIYLTDSLGARVQLLQNFPQVPGVLRWLRGDSGLRFSLLDSTTGKSAIWQLALAGEHNPVVLSLVRLGITIDDCCNTLSKQDREGGSFLSGNGVSEDRILYLHPMGALHSGTVRLEQMNRLLGTVGALSLDPMGKRLFVLSDSADPADTPPVVWTDLIAFDMGSHVFRPYLPGVVAVDLDFSRDGKRIAWVNPFDRTVWIGLRDGSEAHRVSIADSNNELPRWAPDGKRIAFMAKFEGRPWRIFIASADGTHVREASTGMDNQGAPTWSPDGAWLAYGNVLCEEANSCAIHKIEISTGRESTLPGSQGLETARWSPNGRFIAALQPETREVFLSNVPATRWKKLAEGINGNNLNWSFDSRYLYASSPNGDKPKIVRISPEDGSVMPAVNLSEFTRMAGRIDPWFGLTQDGSIIFVRRHQPSEIYALSLR
ncbi:MAG: hypothetical protein WB622_05770 [Acidobacteriaceae bacterium]